MTYIRDFTVYSNLPGANELMCYMFQQIRDGMEDDLRAEDIPSEAHIESMEEDLESSQSKQKNLFLIIFQVQTLLTLSNLYTLLCQGNDGSTTFVVLFIEAEWRIYASLN